MKETIQLKTCTKCGLEKPITEFGKHKLMNDGFRNDCKSCRKTYYNKNCEYIKSKSSEYKRNNPDVNYRHCKQYRLNHTEDDNKRKRKWEKLHPEYMAEKRRKRRATKLKVFENYTRDDELYTKELFNSKCANCNSRDDLCIDHHNPLYLGNALTRSNAVVLCRKCNSSKGIISPEEFYDKEKLLWIESKLNQFE
jgi:5-methylcytosine-specific restriction endonuclease McrA